MGSNHVSRKNRDHSELRTSQLLVARPSLSCVTTKCTSSALRWLKVWMMLSGGTTGWSTIIFSSSFAAAMMSRSIARAGFMMNVSMSTYQNQVASGNWVRAWRIATTFVQDTGAFLRSYSPTLGKNVA